MMQMKIKSLVLGLSVCTTLPVLADTVSDAHNQNVATDSTGIPFGVAANTSGTSTTPASAFTDKKSELYVPVQFDGKPMTLQTNGGRLQVSSRMANAPVPVPEKAQPEPQPANDLIARGKYLTEASDCSVCHTASGGKPYAGGLSFKTPFGTMYSSNITPDAQYGIGSWSEKEFINAVKHGKRNDGANLYPSMPYTSYVKLTDDDTKAIFAYLKTLPAVHQAPPENLMGFPYNQRWSLAFWNLANFKDQPFAKDTKQNDQWNRGAYVATALGHCEECHTPRNITMGLSSNSYAGASVDGWLAFNISPDNKAGIGSWSNQDIVKYLQTGSLPGKATAAGPMAEVISHSTRFMSQDDLEALAVYLKSQPARNSGETIDRFTRGATKDNVADLNRGVNPGAEATGAELFNGNCAACHGTSGTGIGKSLYYPSLVNNSAVGSADPGNLVQVIINGVQRKNAAGDDIVMPGFGSELNDKEIATLATYVTHNYGDGHAAATAEQVSKLRTNEVTVIPGWVLILAGVVGALVVLAIIIFLLKRRKK